MKSGDISKAESAKKVLENLIAVISKAVKEICDLEKDAKLVPRYHHKALIWLIAEKLFVPGAYTFVQSLADQMPGQPRENFSKK